MFYEFNQNNSGGYFVVNDKLCHLLFIEADSESEAVEKALDLGCYFNGVAKGIDCPCCGDRWSDFFLKPIDVEGLMTKGWRCTVFATVEKWYEKYGKYEIVESPKEEKGILMRSITGRIRFRDLEEYAQFNADEYGWTIPDVRIYYKDGSVKEIYSKKDGLEGGEKI